MVKVKIDQKLLEVELQTGASVSLISKETWKQVFPMLPCIFFSPVKLNTHSGQG